MLPPAIHLFFLAGCMLAAGSASRAARAGPFRTQINYSRCFTAFAMAGEASARGAFILFEGVDRSGKSTQAAKLAEALKSKGVSAAQCAVRTLLIDAAAAGGVGGASPIAWCAMRIAPAACSCAAPQPCATPRNQIPAELWNFPDRTTAVGKSINEYLQGSRESDDAAIHLLFSANRWEKRCVRV